jgi:hypothetical protein
MSETQQTSDGTPQTYDSMLLPRDARLPTESRSLAADYISLYQTHQNMAVPYSTLHLVSKTCSLDHVVIKIWRKQARMLPSQLTALLKTLPAVRE